MILSLVKCHSVCLGKDTVNDMLKFCDKKLEASTLEAGLVIKTDHNLNFEDHIKALYSKGAKKSDALLNIANFIDYSKRNLHFQSIVKSQFRYCPFVGMFCSKTLNNLINSIHKRSLKIIYNYQYSSFTQLLRIQNDTAIHQQNFMKS